MQMTQDAYRYLWQCTRLNHIAPIYANIPEFNVDYYKKVLATSSVIFKKGALFMDDLDNGLMTISGGIRLTTNNPEHPKNTIHMVGPSNVLATYCENKHTVASFVRNLCSKHTLLKDYAVMNYGTTSGDMSNYVLQLQALDLKEKDIVILLGSDWFYDTNKGEETTWEYIVLLNDYCRERNVKFAFFRRPEIKNMITPSARELLLMANSYEELAKENFTKNFVNRNKKYVMPSYLSHAIAAGCTCFDLALAVERPHNYGEIFADKTHLGPSGNNLIAHAMFDLYLKHVFADTIDKRELEKRTVSRLKCLFNENASCNEQIAAWLNSVKKGIPFSPNDANNTYGCIVMNANPFTNGHLYLVEQALQDVDYLYLFVVEEDSSDFSFDERFFLVKKGVQQFSDRIAVLPSGQFIISSFTFPEYFTKSREVDVKADTSTDIALFGTTIAPQLNITHRFVGEENSCNVTRQYNEMMARLLPLLDVDFCEIPRCTATVQGEEVCISASTVRNLLKQKKIDDIRELVPDTTFNFLKTKFA